MRLKEDHGRRDIIIQRFQKYVVKDSVKARQIIKQLDYKNDAYLLRCIAITYKDEALFKSETEMRKKFIKRKLLLAEKYINKAFSLKPDCRDVLYTKGVIINAFGDTLGAIDCYIRVIEMGEKAGENVNCSNSDLPFIQMILNDARFQLYRLFHDLKNYELANKFLKAYKINLRKGIDTIYKPLNKFLMRK